MGFAETFKALSDPIRREILVLLKKGRMSAGDIGSHFDMTGATISYHLSILKKAELVFEAIVKDAGLQVDEQELADYVAEIQKTANSSEGNSFFAKEENIYKMIGVGNLNAGKTYFLNQDAVREYVLENYQ